MKLIKACLYGFYVCQSWLRAVYACRRELALLALGAVAVIGFGLAAWDYCTPQDWPRIEIPFGFAIAFSLAAWIFIVHAMPLAMGRGRF